MMAARIARLAALVAVATLLAACSSAKSGYPACDPAVPPPTKLLADPAFASLTFHKNDQYDVRRGFGYDLWADSKFEFRTGLEYALVPRPGGKTEDDLCSFGATLRFALPADEADRRKLSVFAHGVTATAAEGDALAARLTQVLASGDKLRPRGMSGTAELEAGRLAHPSRGDFFMVKLTWPKPDTTPK